MPRRSGGQQLGLFAGSGGAPRGRAASRSRLFFALSPPVEVRAALAQVIARMPPGAAARAKKVRAERLHLTLAFLGDMNRVQQDAAKQAAERVSATGFDLAIDTVGFFPGVRVAWVGPSESPSGLLRLKAELDRELLHFGLPVEQAAYRPHITCLRGVRDEPDVEPFRIDWTVKDFVLMRSPSEPGAPYEPLGCWPLQAL
jgi:2'-5' RNA ligase